MGSTSIINRRARLSWTFLQTIVSQHMQRRCLNTTLPACISADNRLRGKEPLPKLADIFYSSAGDQKLEGKAQWQSAWLFAAAGLMAFSTTKQGKAFNATEKQEAHDKSSKNLKVVFVLGGPGSGKGTQCARIVDSYGFRHLSAGDLLRAEIKSGSANGNMIQGMIKEGKIVPSEVTVKLLQKAMNESSTDKFLIDGFPRNEENRAAFEEVTGISPEFILFFDCPESELERRLLGRNEGRVDDNIETIRKRFQVFIESSIPVIEHYESVGKVRKINATKTKDEVFSTVQPLFEPFLNTSAVQD